MKYQFFYCVNSVANTTLSVFVKYIVSCDSGDRKKGNFTHPTRKENRLIVTKIH